MRSRLAALACLGLLAALLVWRSGSGAGQLRYYAPEDYVERADAFINARHLTADCSGDRPLIKEDIRKSPPSEQNWYEESYLADDVQRFNRDPGFGWAFVIDEDCLLRGVNPSVHRIELPFGETIQWLGSLFYRGGGAQALLRSAERSISLRHPDRPVPASEEATTRVGSAQDITEKEVVLLHFAAGRGQPAARLFPVGRETVVSNRVRRNSPEAVRILGHQLPAGRMARLATGDWLHLEADAPARASETFVYVGASALTAASRVLLNNDRYRRTTDDPGLGLLPLPGQDEPSPYLALVAQSVDSALAALPEERARELARGFDAQLTLEREVQRGIDQAFRTAVQAVQAQHPGRPFGAGMTVLDGKSGDILALATYPGIEAMANLEIDDEAERRRLLANQNLRLHPIGSSGKPFLFTAVAHAFPFLLGLEIDGYAGSLAQRDVLHCELTKGYRVPEGYGGRLDFRTALQISSNRYTIELATLALAANGGHAGSLEDQLPRDRAVAWPRPGQPSGVLINGRALDYAPALEFIHRENRGPADSASRAAVRCISMDNLESVRFRHPLELLTGAPTYWGTDPARLPESATVGQLNRAYRTHRSDLSVFAPLLARLFEGASDDEQWKIRAAAQEMSPERVNLAFNQVSRLREDYVTLLLGGGNSIWTNIQLAEAMSRLVTGRAVEARLVSRVLPRREGEAGLPPPEPPRPPAPVLDIRPEARQAVLEGIIRVGRPGGTAPAMQPALNRHVRPLFPEDRIDVFSKTGSPVLERPVSREVARSLETLVRRSKLEFSGRSLLVRTLTGNVPHRFPGESGRSQFRAALTQALKEGGGKIRGRGLVSNLADLLDELAEDMKAGRADPEEGPIYVDNGAIRLNREHRLFRQSLAPGKGAVYVFSLVRRPGSAPEIPSPAELANPGTRVLTVAIFLGVGPDSHVAVEVATRMLPTLAPLLK